MAEAHPVGFQWVVEAKARGAKVIHVDIDPAEIVEHVYAEMGPDQRMAWEALGGR